MDRISTKAICPRVHTVSKERKDRPAVDREDFLAMSLRTYIEHYIRLIDKLDNENQKKHQKIKDKEFLQYLRDCRRMAKKDLSEILKE